MAPIELKDASVNPSDLSDEESYIEEEILDSEEELTEEEIIEEEVVSDDDMEDSDIGTDSYTDDESSAPPPSLADSDGPVVEGYAFRATRAGSAEITEEARKAKTGDEVEKEKSVGRQAARDALLRETHLQEKTLKAMELGGPDAEEILRIRIQQQQQLVARRRLAEEIEKMDIKKSKKKRDIASDQLPPSTADLEKRKKALGELRRHAAFQELARDNTKLKAEKAARSVASASTNTSIGQPLDSPELNEIKAVDISYEQLPVSPLARDNTKLKAEKAARSVGSASTNTSIGRPLDFPELFEMKAVEISYEQVLVSPLKAKEDPSQTNKSVSQTFALPPSSRKLEQNETTIQSITSSQSQTSNGSGRINKENAGQSAGSEHKSPSTSSSRSSLTNKNVVPELIPTMFRASFMKMVGKGAPELKASATASEIQSPTMRRRHSIAKSTFVGKEVDPGSILRRKNSIAKSTFVGKEVDPGSIPSMCRTTDLWKAATENSTPVVRVDGKFYPLADLQAKRVEGIDNTGREQYLSPEDFLATFSMTKEEFAKLPKWKRDKAKTSVKLF
jgi:hypothetical protein